MSLGWNHQKRKLQKGPLVLLLTLFFGMIVSLILVLFYEGQLNTYRDSLVFEEEVHLRSREHTAATRFQDVVADVQFLSQLGSLQEAIETQDYSQVQQDFKAFAQVKEIYSQVRFLDVQGNEQVRVNLVETQPEIVAQNKLQKKSHRYYFPQTMALLPGETYVSPLDLNIENHELEQPFSPMIRFSTAVFSHQVSQGIVILNFPAKNLLEEITGDVHDSEDAVFLLNEEGYYLSSTEQEKEWGFMFLEGKDFRFQNDYPLLAPSILSTHASSIEFETPEGRGVFISRRIRPMVALSGMPKNYHWTMVVRIDAQTLSEHFSPMRRGLIGMGVFITLLSVFPSILIARMYIQSKSRRDALEHSANYDRLTALPNRRFLITFLANLLMTLHKEGSSFAVLFLDLDGFKGVNDNHGHDAGDHLLKQVAHRLSETVRESDVVARYGGDEFVVVALSVTSWRSAGILAGKLVDAISQPFNLSGHSISIGVSIGIRCASTQCKNSPEEVIRDADAAMYEAKKAGKGQFRFHGNSTDC